MEGSPANMYIGTLIAWPFQSSRAGFHVIYRQPVPTFPFTLHSTRTIRLSAMDSGPPPKCSNYASLPDDMLLDIFERCLATSDAPFSILSSCSKEFHKLIKDNNLINKLRFDCTPGAVAAMTPASVPLLKGAAKAGNHAVGCLLGLHLLFNGNEPEEGMAYIDKHEIQPIWPSRYIRAMGLLKLDQKEEASHALQSFLEDIEFDKATLLEFRELLCHMLHPGKHSELGVTNLCKFYGPGHWQFKTDDEIEAENELDVTCPFCMIDVETYKFKHNIH